MSSFMTYDDFKKHVSSITKPVISKNEIKEMEKTLKPLLGTQFSVLSIPQEVLIAFEPSQIGTIIGSLMDACIPYLSKLTDSDEFNSVGLTKNQGILGEREGYPDYIHTSGKRLELKLLFVDNPNIELKKPPTPREPSARLTQKVTFKNVDPEKDILLVIAYALLERKDKKGFYSPTIIDFNLFPVFNCILARDERMYSNGGGWFGYFETPTIISRIGQDKVKRGVPLNYTSYGRKEEEGMDFNEDTNFGKLKRIPYKPLKQYIDPETHKSFF